MKQRDLHISRFKNAGLDQSEAEAAADAQLAEKAAWAAWHKADPKTRAKPRYNDTTKKWELP